MHETLWEMHRTQDQFISQIDMLTQKIMELQNAVLGQQQSGQGPPQYTRQYSGGGASTLQVPGTSTVNLNSTTDVSSAETFKVPSPAVHHDHGLSHSQSHPRSHQDLGDDQYGDYFAVRGTVMSPSQSKAALGNDEQSPLIAHEMH